MATRPFYYEPPTTVSVSLEEQIESIITRDVHTIGPESPVIEAAGLMVKGGIDCLIVTSVKGAIGILTERDLLRKVTALGKNPSETLVKEVMSSPLISTSVFTTVGEAAKLMSDQGVRRLVVTGGDGDFIGIITMTDLVKWLASKEKLSESLMNYLTYEVF
jgi:CBS domain-containing protein